VTASPVDQPLPTEVRQRLISIASDLIGARPVAELPASLRRFARFTAAKRLRMAGAEIAAALAGDPDFRDAVAEVITESAPELADQVRAGNPPSTADPVDVGVIAYLVRPTGWEQLVATVIEVLGEQHERRSNDADILRLQAEVHRLTEANRQLKAARDALKLAAAETANDRDRELTSLRHQVRTLTGELRTALRRTEQAEEQLVVAQRELARAATAQSAELRKARTRIAALESELDTGRRTVRSDRDHDDARVWLLLEQMGASIAGLRKELDISKPSVSPADRVASDTTESGSRPSTIGAPLLDRLLEGPHVHLVVDGYNLTKTAYPDLPLADQRTRLVSALGALAARTRVEVTVAFDGTAASAGSAASLPTPRGVRVLFSSPGQLADDLIRVLLRAEPEGRTVVVATSDQAVAASVRTAGGWPVAASVLLARLG
jgi:predicted RNA-binding protein with PIN domain